MYEMVDYLWLSKVNADDEGYGDADAEHAKRKDNDSQSIVLLRSATVEARASVRWG